MTESGPASSAEFFISRLVIVTRELVFCAWTEPSQLALWWGPRGYTNPVCEIDLRVGGAYRIVMRDSAGTDYPLKGVYREITPPERLMMTVDCAEHPPHWHDLVKPDRDSGEDNPAGEMQQNVTFENLGGLTLLTVHTHFQSPAIRAALMDMGLYAGWSQSLERLAAQLGSR